MATAKERHIQAELMKDPAYAEAWNNYCQAVDQVSFDNIRAMQGISIEDRDARVKNLTAAAGRIYELTYNRPDLPFLIEEIEAENH